MNHQSITLGLRENWHQFMLLVIVNAFVGAMIGLERTILPLIAEADFGLISKTVVLSFLISFGLVKALANLFAGRLGDRYGRKPILILGWLIGLPVPLIIILAPSWGWVVFANVLLGINQGFCWSMTVIMKIDLVGPKQRGLAMGLNEFAGYLAVSLSALMTGFLAAAHGFRPIPFIPGLLFAALGLLFSLFFVQETRAHAHHEANLVRLGGHDDRDQPSFSMIFMRTSWQDKTLFAVCQAGLVNNLNDGMVWGLVPLLLAGFGVPVAQVALVAAAYPAVWGLGQLFTGALSDRWGRKWLIATGMGLQAVGISFFVVGRTMTSWLTAAILLGVGTAMVYPTLLAAISDVAHPTWRGSAVGVYRLWRDLGFAIGGILAGLLSDLFNIPVAIAVIGGLTLVSGIVVGVVMRETHSAYR
ncbi:MAG: MFS transporter [Candidatus Promineifilaceae bacterium]